MNFKSSSFYFLLTSLVIPVLLIAGYIIYKDNFQKLPVLGPVKTVKGKSEIITTPEWTFTDQNNEQFSSSQVKDDIQVLNFFFTSCPSICPTMNKNVQKVQQVFIDNENLQFVSITVDPDRDTPEKLKDYEEVYSLNHKQWHFLTGDKNKIYLMARKGYNLMASDADGDAADFIHSQQVLLIDPNQKIRGIYDGTEEKDMGDLVKDINKLQKELKRKG